MANMTYERCSTSASIRQLQTPTTTRQHFAPVSAAIAEASTDNTRRPERGERGILVLCWWDCKWVPSVCVLFGGASQRWKQSHLETQQFHFWHVSEGIRDMNSKRYMHLRAHCSSINNTRDAKATQLPNNGQPEKGEVVRVQTIQ